MKKFESWQLNFINGYLFCLSNPARRRIIGEDSYPFLKNITTDEWIYLLNKIFTSNIHLIEEPRWKPYKSKYEKSKTPNISKTKMSIK